MTIEREHTNEKRQPARIPKGMRAASIDVVLFDLDGTLIDTVELILSSMRHATREVLGRTIPDVELMKNVGAPLVDMMQRFDPGRVEELVEVYRAHNRRVHDESVREYPGVTEMLVELRDSGTPMGIVTSKSRAIALRGLDLFGLREFFEVIVCLDDVPIHKPDPYPLRSAAGSMGIELNRCAYVGDSPHDMAAAISGGAVSAAALWGAFPQKDLLAPGPRYALDSPSDVAEWYLRDSERYIVRSIS